MPLCEESILSAMRPRFPGTLRQPTGIPDRWASWGPFLGQRRRGLSMILWRDRQKSV